MLSIQHPVCDSLTNQYSMLCTQDSIINIQWSVSNTQDLMLTQILNSDSIHFELNTQPSWLIAQNSVVNTQCSVNSTQCSVLSSQHFRYPVLRTQQSGPSTQSQAQYSICFVHSIQYSILMNQCSAFCSQYQVLSRQSSALSTQHSVLSFQCSAFSTQHSTLNTRYAVLLGTQ